MDGTLLNSNHEVSDRFLKQFQKLKEKNIKFVAASGRQYHSMREKLHAIKDVPGTHAMLCGKYTSYFDESSSQFLDMLKEYYSEYKVVENFNEVDDEILKVAVYHDTNAEKYVYPNFKDLENEVKVKVSGRHWVDLNNITAHKGHALQKVMDLYNLQPNQVLAFGDYNNDIEMLSLVDYSFAMANAHASVKKIATYETKSNDAYGVESVLEKLI